MDKIKGAVKVARYGGQLTARQEAVEPAPDQKKEHLFLIAKILRLRKADESKEWAIRNLGESFGLTPTIYNIREERPDLNVQQILELLSEQTSL